MTPQSNPADRPCRRRRRGRPALAVLLLASAPAVLAAEVPSAALAPAAAPGAGPR
jgi:hypothetical protein